MWATSSRWTGDRPPTTGPGLIRWWHDRSDERDRHSTSIPTRWRPPGHSHRAEKLVFLTDVAGLRSVPDDPSTLISNVTADELDALVPRAPPPADDPKAQACARRCGPVSDMRHILDGRTRTPPARGVHRRGRRDHGGRMSATTNEEVGA